MGRAKVNLTYIKNDTARKVSYQKRVKGLLKKTEQLSVLCDVDALAIVYSPYDTNPVSWPPSREAAIQAVMRFKGMRHFDQANREFTQKKFLDDSVTKSEEKLKRATRTSLDYKMQNVMLDLLAGKPVEQVPFENVKALTWVIEDRMRTMQHRIRVLEGTDNNNANPGLNPNNPLRN